MFMLRHLYQQNHKVHIYPVKAPLFDVNRVNLDRKSRYDGGFGAHAEASIVGQNNEIRVFASGEKFGGQIVVLLELVLHSNRFVCTILEVYVFGCVAIKCRLIRD
jgi:hypothetical protein